MPTITDRWRQQIEELRENERNRVREHRKQRQQSSNLALKETTRRLAKKRQLQQRSNERKIP
jgi:hypothetical protein